MRIEAASPEQLDAMLKLFPLLASFDVPNNRNPDHLWTGDAAMLRDWAAGKTENCFVHVACEDDGEIIGVAVTSMRPELLSQAPSAHLEVIVSSESARGRGVGQAMLAAAEEEARTRGARAMSLHVFANNEGARAFYDKCGYDGELMRYIKRFDKDALQ